MNKQIPPIWIPVADKYTLKKVIGKGAFGLVMLAKHKATGE